MLASCLGNERLSIIAIINLHGLVAAATHRGLCFWSSLATMWSQPSLPSIWHNARSLNMRHLLSSDVPMVNGMCLRTGSHVQSWSIHGSDAFTTTPFRCTLSFPEYSRHEMAAILAARMISEDLLAPFVLLYTATRVRSFSLPLSA